VIVKRARHEWPLLWLVPERLMRPVIHPSAARVRRALLRALVITVAAAAVLVLVFVGSV
jgi:hypothetical protein